MVGTCHTDGWDDYLRWLQRAETGMAAPTLLEIDEARATRSGEVPVLWSFARSFALERLGRVDEAARAVEPTPDGLPEAIRLMLISRRSTLSYERDQLEALRLYAHGESVIRRHQDQDDVLWWHAVVHFSTTAIHLGQTERALALMRTCLARGETRCTRWDWFVLHHNYAETLVGDALRPARRHPFEADVAELTRAIDYGRVAHALAAEINVIVKPSYHDIWWAFRHAWCGDPAAALTVLDPAVDGAGHLTESLLWLAAASRLRALRRLGDTDRVAGLLDGERAMANSLPRICWDTVAPLLWERALAGASDLGEPATEMGLLADAWERRDADRQQYTQVLVDALVGRDALDAERREHQARALLDTLTGLYNRRGMDPHLRRAAASGAPHAILVIDLDRFKEINDTAGHIAGDRALITVAESLIRTCHQHDLAARFGGDEFVVLLAPRDRMTEAAVDIARRLIDVTGVPSLSIGIAVNRAPITPERWLHTADTAMYHSKRAGGGRFTLAAEAPVDAPLTGTRGVRA